MTSARASTQPRAWQRMLSGRRLDLLDPSPLDIEIEDIAHGLARVARWNGQTRGAHVFSVAQHALLVETIAVAIVSECDARQKLAILLHDGAEYVIGDIISPFKAVLAESYKPVEHRILSAIYRRFGLPARPDRATQQLLKRADQIAAWHEATRLAGFGEAEALRLFGRPSLTLQPRIEASILLPDEARALLEPMPTEQAEAAFLARFHALDFHASGLRAVGSRARGSDGRDTPSLDSGGLDRRPADAIPQRPSAIAKGRP